MEERGDLAEGPGPSLLRKGAYFGVEGAAASQLGIAEIDASENGAEHASLGEGRLMRGGGICQTVLVEIADGGGEGLFGKLGVKLKIDFGFRFHFGGRLKY